MHGGPAGVARLVDSADRQSFASVVFFVFVAWGRDDRVRWRRVVVVVIAFGAGTAGSHGDGKECACESDGSVHCLLDSWLVSPVIVVDVVVDLDPGSVGVGLLPVTVLG